MGTFLVHQHTPNLPIRHRENLRSAAGLLLVGANAFAGGFQGKTLTLPSMSGDFQTNKVIEDIEAAVAKGDRQVVPNEQYLNRTCRSPGLGLTFSSPS